jgi:hypothetical protein
VIYGIGRQLGNVVLRCPINVELHNETSQLA